MTQITAEGFWELYYLALTFHGRVSLTRVISLAEQDEILVDSKILDLYRVVLQIAPYQALATIN